MAMDIRPTSQRSCEASFRSISALISEMSSRVAVYSSLVSIRAKRSSKLSSSPDPEVPGVERGTTLSCCAFMVEPATLRSCPRERGRRTRNIVHLGHNAAFSAWTDSQSLAYVGACALRSCYNPSIVLDGVAVRRKRLLHRLCIQTLRYDKETVHASALFLVMSSFYLFRDAALREVAKPAFSRILYLFRVRFRYSPPGVMPLAASSCSASGALSRWPRPMPRSTWPALVNWIFV